MCVDVWILVLESLTAEDWLALRRGSRTCHDLVDAILSDSRFLNRHYHSERALPELEYDQQLPNAVAPPGLILGNPFYQRPDPERVLDNAIRACIRLDRLFEGIARLRNVQLAPSTHPRRIQDTQRYQDARAQGLEWYRRRAQRATPQEWFCLLALAFMLYLYFFADGGPQPPSYPPPRILG